MTFDLAVGAGENQPLVTVGKPHQIRRLALFAPYLDDFALLFSCADCASVYADPVSHGCLHR
ncbi:hypothetical protein BA062_05550 [Prauserella flavalba]|uniref:Uncharacterized protein n=1 Tax=Prauserella flavalba TaxID=1477506 RepID=A0A318LZ71_9PSEU|nr:hypothetical protein BA062_05550 [Prauserella flavalba]